MKVNESESTESAQGTQRRRRFVVKVGSNVLVPGDSDSVQVVISGLVQAICDLLRSGVEVALVSSGAIAMGRALLKSNHSEVPLLSSIGQSALTSMYDRTFQKFGVVCAQLLVTNYDLSDPSRSVNLSNTIKRCMQQGFVPVLNENDASTHWSGSQRKVFEDNDMLAAIVASNIEADCLVVLTDVDGVFTCDPASPDAQLVVDLRTVSEDVAGSAGAKGRGGMLAKVRAVKHAVEHGCKQAIIANGGRKTVLQDIAAGKNVGTSICAIPR